MDRFEEPRYEPLFEEKYAGELLDGLHTAIKLYRTWTDTPSKQVEDLLREYCVITFYSDAEEAFEYASDIFKRGFSND